MYSRHFTSIPCRLICYSPRRLRYRFMYIMATRKFTVFCFALATIFCFLIISSHFRIQIRPVMSPSDDNVQLLSRDTSGEDPIALRNKREDSISGAMSGNNVPFLKKDKFIVFDAKDYEGRLTFLNNASSNGWAVLVVNLPDIKMLASCAECQALTDTWVDGNVFKALPGSSQKLLPQSTVNKMAAYVFALAQGAQWIFTTDFPNTLPLASITRVTKHEARTAPVYQGPNSVFEPCSHFMDPFIWFGKQGTVGNKWGAAEQGRYNVKVVSTHSVHYFVGECFKQGMDRSKWKFGFDKSAPPPYVMPGTYAAIDFRNVLVSRASAWTLVASLDIPQISPESRMEPYESLLSLMVQRVMWETNQQIGIFPKPLSSYRQCTTCSVNDKLKMVGSDFRTGISSWRCETFENVPKCLLNLASISEYNSKKVTAIHELVKAWGHLTRSQSPPQRISLTDSKLSEKNVGTPFVFTAAKSMGYITSNDTRPPNAYSQLCATPESTYKPVLAASHPITDILAIIIFNFHDLTVNIPFLEYTYGRHFKHILYCGASLNAFTKDFVKPSENRNPVSFVEIPIDNGWWGQSCISAAVKMNYDVAGYLHISDDVLVNVWNLYRLPRNQPWFQHSLRVAPVDWETVPDVWSNKSWWPWNQFFGKVAALRAHEHFESMRDHAVLGDKVTSFLDNLHAIADCDRCFLYEASDIYYVPQHLGHNFTFFADIFTHYQVFLEIAIPSTLAGITSDTDVFRLRGNYLWFQDRQKYQFVYSEFDHFYHAWKHSQFSNPQDKKFYCEKFLPKIDRDLVLKGGSLSAKSVGL